MKHTNLVLGGNWHADEWPDYVEVEHDDGRDRGAVRYVPQLVLCADCSHCKPTTDGRRYCALWSHIVPDDGFCWRGEEVES